MRYLPLTSDDRQAMLARIGVADIDALFKDVPQAARLSDPVDLPAHQSELAVGNHVPRCCRKGTMKTDYVARFEQFFETFDMPEVALCPI